MAKQAAIRRVYYANNYTAARHDEEIRRYLTEIGTRPTFEEAMAAIDPKKEILVGDYRVGHDDLEQEVVWLHRKDIFDLYDVAQLRGVAFIFRDQPLFALSRKYQGDFLYAGMYGTSISIRGQILQPRIVNLDAKNRDLFDMSFQVVLSILQHFDRVVRPEGVEPITDWEKLENSIPFWVKKVQETSLFRVFRTPRFWPYWLGYRNEDLVDEFATKVHDMFGDKFSDDVLIRLTDEELKVLLKMDRILARLIKNEDNLLMLFTLMGSDYEKYAPLKGLILDELF